LWVEQPEHPSEGVVGRDAVGQRQELPELRLLGPAEALHILPAVGTGEDRSDRNEDHLREEMAPVDRAAQVLQRVKGRHKGSFARDGIDLRVAATDSFRDAGIEYDEAGLIRYMGGFWQRTLAEIDRARAALRWSSAGRYHVCRYEDLCHDPTRILSQLLRFIDVTHPSVIPQEAVENMNHKFRERLDPTLMGDLTMTLAPTLAAQGYSVEPDPVRDCSNTDLT
jgi:hypothetical protein